MRYSQISVLITAIFLCLLSCRETIGEQHNSLPKENKPPALEKRSIENPIPKDSVAAPLQRQKNKETKKKKRKASDTLKPKMALLKSA